LDGGLRCIEARVDDSATAELVVAEAWSAGASGIEERELCPSRILLLLYAPVAVARAVRSAALAVAGSQVGPVGPVEEKDWSRAWQRGLHPIEVGQRLLVRPSFVAADLRSGQLELVIDPGRAFGTGGHASTLLALEWIEVESGTPTGLRAETRVLDVGVGTGVLALAALRLGAGSAVGLDLDPEAAIAARECAQQNGLSDRLQLFTGPVDALSAKPFDWVFANLLKSELMPIATQLAAVTRSGGRLIVSGLLAAERAEVEAALGREGFTMQGIRTRQDSTGDTWISMLMARA
jgi:ribosomal protein L11 methyltransferase